MKILLICAQGMSTSMLVQRIYNYAEEGDVIDAVPFGTLNDVIGDFEVVLLGPQIRYKLNEVKLIAKEFNIVADMVDMRAYGKMDGKAVYEQAKALLKNKGELTK